MTARATVDAWPPPMRSAAPKTAEWSSSWQVWGAILIAPYVLVFLLFVLYPVGYGFWLARDPHNYVELLRRSDLRRGRSATRSSSSLVGVNLKMFVALLLSGFFTQNRWWIRVVAALHPALGGAVDPDHPVLPLHAQSRMGHRQPGHLPPHRRGRPELAQHAAAGAGLRDPRPHLEVAAVLDADPDLRAPRDPGRPLRSRVRRRRERAGSNSAS